MWTKTDIRRVSGETLLREDTIVRWLRGGPTRATSVKLIMEAAERLGIPLPTRDGEGETGSQQRVA
jgi:hypothetical protein